jgi:hypothetical protein
VAGYEWDFDCNGTIDATGPRVRHPGFATVGEKCVRLIVHDNRLAPARSLPNECRIQVTPPPFPPTANPGGPYVLGVGRVVLEGGGSQDPDGQIRTYAWEFDPQPINRSFDDAVGPTVDVTAYFAALGPGRYDVGLRVTDDSNSVDTAFTTVTVLALGGNAAGAPPTFAPQSPQGTVMAVAGADLAVEVSAADRDSGDVVALELTSALPAGARFTSTAGNPARAELSWQPGFEQVGRHRVRIAAVDRAGHRVHSTFDLEVAQCFLLLAEGVGDDVVTAGTHTFRTGLRRIRSIRPLARPGHEWILMSPHAPDAVVPAGIAVRTPLVELGAAQVVMWNPAMFPRNPEQSSSVIELRLTGPGQVAGTRRGPADGMSIGVRSRQGEGRTFVQFPFTINGL